MILSELQLSSHHGDNLTVQTSAISILPADVLAIIFETAIHSTDNAYQEAQVSPINIAQVSRFWRIVALGSPFLWVNVNISSPMNPEMIQAFLNRSTTYPIHVSINLRVKEALTASRVSSGCYSIIPHFHRCRTLTIRGYNVPSESFLLTLLKALSEVAAPLLESLTVEEDALDGIRDGLALFTSAPRLKEVRFSSFSVLKCRPPLSQVTSLHLSAGTYHLTSSLLFSALKQYTSLTALSFYDDVYDFWPDFTHTCCLPSLISLRLYGNVMCPSDLLLGLIAPNLHDLTIMPVVPNDLQAFFDAREESALKFPLLQQLTLLPAHPQAFNVIQTAAVCFPTVTSLTLPNIYPKAFTRSFFSLEWPGLSHLALRSIDLSTQYAVQAVVEHRHKMGIGLKKLILDPASIANMSNVETLREIVNVEESYMWANQRREAWPSLDVEQMVLSLQVDEPKDS